MWHLHINILDSGAKNWTTPHPLCHSTPLLSYNTTCRSEAVTTAYILMQIYCRCFPTFVVCEPLKSDNVLPLLSGYGLKNEKGMVFVSQGVSLKGFQWLRSNQASANWFVTKTLGYFVLNYCSLWLQSYCDLCFNWAAYWGLDLLGNFCLESKMLFSQCVDWTIIFV